MSWKVKASIAFWLVAGVGWYLWQQRDDTPLEPIVITDGAITVRNQTTQDWQAVRIWVNEHYFGGARTIPAGGFVREPLSSFVASQGQKMNPASTKVTSVVVLGSHDDGTRVRVVWGTPFLH